MSFTDQIKVLRVGSADYSTAGLLYHFMEYLILGYWSSMYLFSNLTAVLVFPKGKDISFKRYFIHFISKIWLVFFFFFLSFVGEM